MKKIDGERLRSYFGLQFYLSLVVIIEIITTVALAVLVSFLLENYHINLDISPLLWVLVLSGGIGSVCAFLLNRWLLSQIPELSKNMREVASGNLKKKVTTTSRIREIQEMYESFNIMTEELSATEILQTDFVSNVSHEFKTPINAIEGYATLLQDETLSEEEEREYVEKILLNTKRLSDLVGNILLLSKVDNQAIPSSRATYSLDEQIRRAILYLEPKWEKKNILFDVELDTVDYYGNESLMLHIWTNLLDNAIKFSPEGGEVRVRLYEKDGNVVFSVSDQGAGIDENAKKHIFDKFYQSETSHKGEGNGLGLALVKRITDLAGGTVTAENLSLGGCRFEVIFPNIKQ
ncbi:MAG: HAMP domain-containing histidine kinase [Clostridia bacterium]|nr:HAMP domain-containing histidine kinase [Clostridia bacterium]